MAKKEKKNQMKLEVTLKTRGGITGFKELLF
jgi:hypothetical protein